MVSLRMRTVTRKKRTEKNIKKIWVEEIYFRVLYKKKLNWNQTEKKMGIIGKKLTTSIQRERNLMGERKRQVVEVCMDAIRKENCMMKRGWNHLILPLFLVNSP